jgi:hypothetical protein
MERGVSAENIDMERGVSAENKKIWREALEQRKCRYGNRH